MKWMGWLLALSAYFAAYGSDAAHHAAEADHGLPWKLILVQAGNLIVLIAALTYFLGRKVQDHFRERSRSYLDLVQRAEKARQEAEQQKRTIESKLRDLTRTFDDSQRQAVAESLQMKEKMKAETDAVSERLAREARQVAAVEIEKAKNQIRQEMLDAALDIATSSLQHQVGEPDRNRLQHEFADKIQVVR